MHRMKLQENPSDYFFCLFGGGRQSYFLKLKKKMEKVGSILRKFRTSIGRRQGEPRI